MNIDLGAQGAYLISKINVHGNNITKDEIVYRELLFSEGQSILPNQLDALIRKSEQNILNTSLFNFATITYQKEDSIRIIFNIDLQERWYVWPYPILEHADRNFSSFLKNEEWSRIDYGLFLLVNNFRGRKEILKLKAIFGFNNSFSVTYYNPYLDKKQKIGIGLEVDYIKNKEVAYQIENNELEYLKIDNKYIREKTNITVFSTYRPQIYLQHLFSLKYEYVYINDSIYRLNNKYFGNNNNQLKCLSLAYNFDFDKRDSKIYPLRGSRLVLNIIKQGLGVLENEDRFYIEAIIEENLKLSKRLYFNTGLLGKYSFTNENSFYFSNALGYRNYLRGMEYYVSAGTNYYISKSNLKFQIIPQTNLNFNFIKSKKFSRAHYALYTNLFFDTGYVKSNQEMLSALSNEFLYSGGIGIDFVTYYDKILRIEYSINKFGEHGIFFHLGAPIIE